MPEWAVVLAVLALLLLGGAVCYWPMSLMLSSKDEKLTEAQATIRRLNEHVVDLHRQTDQAVFLEREVSNVLGAELDPDGELDELLRLREELHAFGKEPSASTGRSSDSEAEDAVGGETA